MDPFPRRQMLQKRKRKIEERDIEIKSHVTLFEGKVVKWNISAPIGKNVYFRKYRKFPSLEITQSFIFYNNKQCIVV